jgi:SAM-dependent methyltransferase
MLKKRFKNINLDSPNVTKLHRQIIKTNSYLYHWYKNQYNKYKEIISGQKNGRHIELGTGGGFIKEVLPFVTTSSLLYDDVKNGFADIVLDAEKLNFEDLSVDSFFLLDTFHHIKHPSIFLAEVDRCLKKNGHLLMIEPANTLFSRFFYIKFHHESFDDTTSMWNNQIDGHLSSANGALGYLVFERDYKIFNKRFPNLSVKAIKKHTFISYMISGGLSYESIFPETKGIADFIIKNVDKIESALTPMMGMLGTYMDIYIRKL